jgi:hypothetical protein
MSADPTPAVDSQATGEVTLAADLPPLPEGLYCPDCGYDLRGLTSNRCPECGFSLEPARTPEPQIPWVHRRQIGRFRAYWRTVAAATFRPKRFCLEILRPVSYSDAQRFRWVTILHAYVPLLVAGLVMFIRGDLSRPYDWGALYWWLTGAACALLELVVLTGTTSYAFHPRYLPVESQNRAVALSYYAWAPLVCTPLALLPFLIALLACRPGTIARIVFMMAAVAICVLEPMAASAIQQVYARRILRGRPKRQAWRDVLVSMLLSASALLFLIVLIVLPLSLFYLLIIVESVS